MKILAVADEESKYLWEYYEPSKLRDIDLIIGCGDLSRHYMNFLSDAAPVPVLYVHGNHDASYDREPPRGAICIDDDLYWYKGYRIVGLGGSCRYRAIRHMDCGRGVAPRRLDHVRHLPVRAPDPQLLRSCQGHSFRPRLCLTVCTSCGKSMSHNSAFRGYWG